jgi:hypothetical protein
MDQLAAYKAQELMVKRPVSRTSNAALDALPNFGAALAQLASQQGNDANEFLNGIFDGRTQHQMVPPMARPGIKSNQPQQFNSATFGPPSTISPYSKAEIIAQLDSNQQPQQTLPRTLAGLPSHMRTLSQAPIPPVSPAFSQASTIVPNSATPLAYQNFSSADSISPETLKALILHPAFNDLVKSFVAKESLSNNGGSTSGSGTNSPGGNSNGHQISNGPSSSQGDSAIGKDGAPGPSGNNRKAGLFKTEL